MAALSAACLVVPAASAGAQCLVFRQAWSRSLPDPGLPVALSSPNVATLEGASAVVVGDRAGHVYAFSLADGRAVPGWPVSTEGLPVNSTPSVAALAPGSPDDTVFVGVGDSSTPHQGGYEALNPDGTERWFVTVHNPASDHNPGQAVPASLAVGELQGSTDVVAPSVGQEEYAIDASSGKTLPGFPWFTSDSDFSTPALADLYGDGRTEIIGGGYQSPGLANGVTYTKGGHLRVISPTGNAGSSSPSAGLDCEYNTDQGVQSSPAVGQFLTGGGVGIAVGTSKWPGASDADKVLAFSTRCTLVWAASLDGATTSSPALADVLGNGGLDVVEGTDSGTSGSVYALSGPTGAVLWRQPVGRVMGSVVTADLGGGYQDVIVPTTCGTDVLDGRTGHILATIARYVGLQNSPLVTDDPNGTIGVTVAGYDGHNRGIVSHFEIAGSSGAQVGATGSWPMFHHDPQLTGNAGVEPGTATARPPATKKCSPPPGGPNGYYEVSSDGSAFSYGDVPFCGSLPATAKQTVVGVATVPDGGGYWLVTGNGRVFAFGDAGSYRPTVVGHERPIVGIAAAPDGRGYWLVARDGQVSAFGDANFYGPKGHVTQGQVIVGIAATADGRGYWLAAQDGKVLDFGDASLRASAAPFRADDIVAIAADRATGGYWLAGADGSVYAFGAHFYGSVAGHNLGYAMTGLQAAPGGSGYRMVDSGGELFCFGTATDLGSAGKLAGAVQVVGIAGF